MNDMRAHASRMVVGSVLRRSYAIAASSPLTCSTRSTRSKNVGALGVALTNQVSATRRAEIKGAWRVRLASSERVGHACGLMVTKRRWINTHGHNRAQRSEEHNVGTARKPQEQEPISQRAASQNGLDKPSVSSDPDLKPTQKIREAVKASAANENVYTLPNILTFSRLIAAPVIGYLVLNDGFAWATGLFIYAGVTDLVDGWIARRYNLQTVVGTVIDPMADKTLMTILTVCLAVKGALPVALATLILGRDVSLSIAALYYRYASLPAPKTLARFWDFSIPSAEVHPTTVSKWNTALQLMLIGAATASPLVPASTQLAGVSVGELMTAAQWTVAGTTLWSGLSYLFTRDAVTILGDRSEQSKRAILRRGRGLIAICFTACLGIAVVLGR